MTFLSYSTAGADSLANIIKTQERMVYPLADVVQKVGLARNPKRSAKSADILQVTIDGRPLRIHTYYCSFGFMQDPHTTYMQIKQGKQLCGYLPYVEQLLLRCRFL